MLAETNKHAEKTAIRREFESFELSSLTPHMGAEIAGIDLAGPLGAREIEDLKMALVERRVLVFRDQHLTRDQHKDLGRYFGPLHSHPMHKAGLRGNDPEILPVVTTPDSAYTAGDGWHTDVTCDEIPPMCSLLYVKEIPGDGGGDTLFANTALAYQLLSDPMKEFLSELTAVHDGALPYVGAYKSTPPEGGYPCSEHPVIRRHPDSGEKILYINSGFTSHIVGLSAPESRAVLDMLFSFIATTPRIQCRVGWEPNTLTIWDNRSTQHHAVWDYHPESRRGERVSVLESARPSA